VIAIANMPLALGQNNEQKTPRKTHRKYQEIFLCICSLPGKGVFGGVWFIKIQKSATQPNVNLQFGPS